MRKRKSALRERIETIIIALALALFIRTFIVQSFVIPSDSMFPTFMSSPKRDRLFVNKFIYKLHPPRRGDIVVFRSPNDPKKNFIKRVVALGGEEVEVKNGDIYIDRIKLTGPEEITKIYYESQGHYGKGKVDVPLGHLYVLGDNSSNSHDSRWWGFVPLKNVKGKAMVIFYPPYRVGKVK